MATRPPERTQMRALYRSLLARPSNFHEFKALLALYPASFPLGGREPVHASKVRARVNARLAEWLGAGFDGMTAEQLLDWRAIVVEDSSTDVAS